MYFHTCIRTHFFCGNLTSVARFYVINLTCLVEDLRSVPNCSSKCVSASEKGGVVRFLCHLVWNECHISNGLVRNDAIYLDKAAETFEE